jgi:hypothetical protein
LSFSRTWVAALSFSLALSAASSAASSRRGHQDKAPTTVEIQVVLTPAQMQALEGEYTNANEPDTPFSIYASNGQLYLENERMTPTLLRASGPTEFILTGHRPTLRFKLDAQGHATSFTLSEGQNQEYTRTGPPVHHLFHDYVRNEAMIPARDGVKLHVVILKPTDIHTPLPFLIQRTPYGCDGTTRESFISGRPELARDGYIYVCGDIRGRYKSEGQFVMMRPLTSHKSRKNVDESTDTYDTVDWLVHNVDGNNGRAGFVGTSYPGFLAMMAGIDPHPAVKAISPQAPMIDVWLGDDFFHNGAFRQSYGYDYVLSMESSKEDTEVSYGHDAQGKNVDGYDFFLERGSFAEDVRHAPARLLPTWKLFLEHPTYDRQWAARGVEQALTTVAVPTLSVGGSYDQEDMYGPQHEYARLEPHDSEHQDFLVLGPWRHGSWNSSSRHLGNIDYGEPIGKEFRANIEAKFFAHYLKDAPDFKLDDTTSFQTGSNTWKSYAHFPPQATQSASLYLAAGNTLSWTAPTAEARTSYVSDPANPVPYRPRPIQPTYSEGSQWYNWLTEDQRFVADRSDVVSFRLPAQTTPLTLTGEVVADIFASTTGSDNDLVVKLIDEYPGNDPDPKMRGYQRILNAEIFRGRYLDGFQKAEALKPGAVREYRFSLHDVDHVFQPGHRILIQIQSSWFPLYDRNPQTFVKNIMMAKPTDYKSATITLVSGPGHDSRLILPVVGQ